MARRAAKGSATPKPKLLGSMLISTSTGMTDEELLVVNNLVAEITKQIAGTVLKVEGPCSMTQVMTKASAIIDLGEPMYRKISMVGDERMEIIGGYFGKRQGMILQLKPLTSPLGMSDEDVKNLTLEMPLGHHGALRLENGGGLLPTVFGETIHEAMGMTAESSVEFLREAAVKSERERLLREATVKVESYGDNWGAF